MAINKCNLSVLVLARIFSVRIYEGGGEKRVPIGLHLSGLLFGCSGEHTLGDGGGSSSSSLSSARISSETARRGA